MTARFLTPPSGKITRGIKPNTFVDKTTKFVERQLPKWRDDKTRPVVEAEEGLNGQLCKFLNDRARDEFPMAYFHHEEKQGKRRRVDLSALPSTKAIEAAMYESIDVPFLVMEGKRLPAPSNDREREYLTGLAKKSGGIQRYRLGLHGQAFPLAMIIGYVQSGEVADWMTTINGWVKALVKSGEDKTCDWTAKDALLNLTNDGRKKASRCESSHLRAGIGDISLIHLWICMSKKAPKRK